MEELIGYVRQHVYPSLQKNKNYIEIVTGTESYRIFEGRFFRTLFNGLKKDDKKLSPGFLKYFKPYQRK
jgi:hypothetical protein